MIDFGKWLHALAQTESEDSPRAWGDSGQACGRWQMHPAFVWEYGPDEVGLRQTWDEVFELALYQFYRQRATEALGPVKLAMMFHLGVEGVKNGGWDEVYAERFRGFYGDGL